MNIIMFGPPGAGKGSVSAVLKEKLNVPHISTGDIVREEAKRPQNKVSSYMEKGELVPDTVMMELVEERLKQDDCKNGFLLDGFPRTIPQAEFLKNNSIIIHKVINLIVPDELLIKRLSGRRMDPKTGRICNINTMKIPADVNKDELIQRKDDTAEVIKNRIEVYHAQTAPVIEFYKKEGSLADIKGTPELDTVVKEVFDAVNA